MKPLTQRFRKTERKAQRGLQGRPMYPSGEGLQ